MKIGILVLREDYRRDLPSSVQMLEENAKNRGHKVNIINGVDCHIVLKKGKMQLFWKEKPFPKFDVVIVRPGFNQDILMHASLIKQLQLMKFTVVNDYFSVTKVKNKIRMHQIMNHYKIPTPHTVVIQSKEYLRKALDEIGSLPVIIKVIEGCAGMGVFIAENKRTLNPIVEFLIGENFNALLIQQYVKDSRNRDVRVFVVGKKVVAAMERIAQKGEFRSNFSIGGKVKLTELSEKEKKMAINATQKFGLDYAGVDIIRSKEGPKILEINSNPGLAGIVEATKINVAEYIIKYAEKKAKRKTGNGIKKV